MASYIECTNKQRRLPPLTIQEYIYTYQDREALDMYLPLSEVQDHLDHHQHVCPLSYHNQFQYQCHNYHHQHHHCKIGVSNRSGNNNNNTYSSQSFNEFTHNEYHQYKSQKLSSDIDLMTHIFRGSLDSNLLRRVLWPVMFNLVEHRDRIVSFNNDFKVIPHECNVERWQQLTDSFNLYLQQWRSISSEQESRFALFRERKSSIERDVIRCDRLHPFYKDQPENLELLTTLLMTYMMYDFDIGYVQGMLDLAAPILFVFEGDLVKAFWIFNEVMKLFRRNFEQSQNTIHFQLTCLFRLIKYTDEEFAQYLLKRDSANCFFAFRCIVCQFKREIMKESEDNYSNVLKLWDTIWCVQALASLKQQQLRQQCCDNSHCGIGAIDIPQQQQVNHHAVADHMCPGHVQVSSTVIEVDGHQHFELSCLNQQHTNQQQNNINRNNNNNHHHHQHHHHYNQSRQRVTLNSSASVVSDLLTNNSSDWTNDDPMMMMKGDNAIGCGRSSTIESSSIHSCKRTESMQSQTSLPDSIPFNGHNNYDLGDGDDRHHQYYDHHHNQHHQHHQSQATRSNDLDSQLTPTVDNSNITTNTNTTTTTLVTTNTTSNTKHHHRSLSDTTKSASAAALGPSSRSNCLCSVPSINNNNNSDLQRQYNNNNRKYSTSSSSARQLSYYYNYSQDQTQADLPRFSLSETETFVLSLCLSLIRRERNLIMDSKLDATEILQHFIDPKLCDNLDLFIEQATNIYSYLKEDFDIERLFEDEKPLLSHKHKDQSHSQNSQRQPRQTFITTNNTMCSTFDEGYDFLNDYLIINSIPED